MNRVTFGLAVIAGVLCTGIETGHATGISGAICQADANSPVQNVTVYPYGATNVATNAGLVVNCAIPAPSDAKGKPTRVNEFNMTYYNRSNNYDIACSLSAFDWNGALLQTWTFNGNHGGPGSGPRIRTILLRPFQDTATYWTVQCNIPPAVISNGASWQSHIVGFDIFRACNLADDPC